jgi:hypothetical protein
VAEEEGFWQFLDEAVTGSSIARGRGGELLLDPGTGGVVGVELVGVVLFPDFVYNFGDAALPLEVELFGREWFSHAFGDVDGRELLAEYFLDVPGGDECLIGGDEDAILLGGEGGTMFSASVGERIRILRLEAELRWKLPLASWERKPLVRVDLRRASRSGS